MRNRNIICYIICLLSLTACVIEDDIPYPLLEGAILSMTVEGQRAGEEGQSVEATSDAKAIMPRSIMLCASSRRPSSV